MEQRATSLLLSDNGSLLPAEGKICNSFFQRKTLSSIFAPSISIDVNVNLWFGPRKMKCFVPVSAVFSLLCYLLSAHVFFIQVDAFLLAEIPPTSARTFSKRTPLFVVAEPEAETKIPISKNNNDGALKRLSFRKPKQIETIEAYKSVVVDETEQIVVVRFFSPVCKSCQAAEKYFKRMCREYPDIKFVEVPVTKNNAYLHEGLGVTSFPFGHIYHPEAGLVEELKINKHVFGEFQRVLQYYVDGQGEVDYPEEGLCEPAGCRVDY